MKKINIAELLKDCPKGMELDCSMYDKVTLIRVDNEKVTVFPIKVSREDGHIMLLTKYGQYSDTEFAKCVIFPKGKTTWEGFQRPFKDGDVVFFSNTIAIFKEWGDETLFRTYCTFYTTVSNPTYQFGISRPLFSKGIRREARLATEEEKQKLFDAIKANGYKWNAENKTLEKLVEPEFKVGDRIRYKRGNRVKLNIESINIKEQFYHTSDKGRIYFKHQDDWELVPNKFDISTLKPFDKVLVRDSNKAKWVITFFSHCNNLEFYKYSCIHNTGCAQCIPYESNEHLLDTTNDCDEYYKTWE